MWILKGLKVPTKLLTVVVSGKEIMGDFLL